MNLLFSSLLAFAFLHEKFLHLLVIYVSIINITGDISLLSSQHQQDQIKVSGYPAVGWFTRSRVEEEASPVRHKVLGVDLVSAFVK